MKRTNRGPRNLLPGLCLGWFLAVTAGLLTLSAQEISGVSDTNFLGSAAKPSLNQIGPGLYEVGKVRLDKRKRTVTFPAVLNMDAGIVEYFLVCSYGKTHESVLRTEVEPYQIHVAMLLLGAKGANTNALPDNPKAALPGDLVDMVVSWNQDGKRNTRRAEDFVLNRMLNSPLSKGPWVYTGSYVFEGEFVAQLGGSIVALFLDPQALVNNPRPGRENDDLWLVNAKGLPPTETPVTVTLKLAVENSQP